MKTADPVRDNSKSSRWSRATWVMLGFSPACLPDNALGQCQSWDPGLSAGPNGTVYTMASFDFGTGDELFVGGYFTRIINGLWETFHIAKWDGSTWSDVGGGVDNEVDALHVFDDGNGPVLYLGGRFQHAGAGGNQVTAMCVARWDGISYSPVGAGFFGTGGAVVRDLETYDDGTGPALYAAGAFDFSGSTSVVNIAKWNGTQWTPLGGGLDSNGYASSLAVYDDGTGPALYVGGYFSSAGGVPVDSFAKWDGSTWAPVGQGVYPGAGRLLVWDDGTGSALFFSTTISLPGGSWTFGVVKWNGSTSTALGSGMNGAILGLGVHDDSSGEALFAGGVFSQADGMNAENIAKWDGTRWIPLGAGFSGSISGVEVLGSFDDGAGARPDLFAGGRFEQVANLPAFHIARWRSCDDPIDSFCLGDGTFADCPCQQAGTAHANFGDLGHGCDNSQFTGGALLTANGSPVPDSIVLRATGELPTALTIFLQGDELEGAGLLFGDGLRCVGGSLKRLYTKSASAGTVRAPISPEPSVTARSAALGDPIAPGSIRYYQTYYRDPNPNTPPCGTGFGGTFNSSNGIRIVW